MRRINAHAVGACLAMMAMAGCNDPLPEPITPSASPEIQGIERYFPLEDGFVYTFEIVDDKGEQQDMLLMRVARPSRDRAKLHTPSGVRELVVKQDSIQRATGGFVLREPIEQGARWPGDNGGTTHVKDVGLRVQVLNETVSGCIRTVEEVDKANRGTVASVYCPGVGLVEMTIEEWQNATPHIKRFVLRSYGAAVDVGGE